MNEKDNNSINVLHNVNWEYLKRFKVCAESKNFKEAAEAIGTTPNTIVNQLTSLEESLGFLLFEKINQNRTNKLTDQGQHLLELITKAALYLNGNQAIKSDQISHEKIKIVTTPGLASHLLPGVVDLFLKEYPNYQIEVTAIGPSTKIESDEIMIRSDIRDQVDIIKEPLGIVSMNLYASEDYIAKAGKPKVVEDLRHHKILTFNSNVYGNTNWALLSEYGFPVTAHNFSNSIDFLHRMCVKGHGIVELAEIYERSPRLKQILENVESPKYYIYIASHKSNLLKYGISKFFDHTMSYCQNYFKQ